MINEYISGSVKRISPEIPVPVVTKMNLDQRLVGQLMLH